jgi:DNA polymerase beta
MDRKNVVLAELSVLQKKEQNARNVFKARAYGKVIAQLKAHEGPIATLEDVAGVPGIGDKIRAKIAEILETGELQEAARVRDDSDERMMTVLTGIYGVGPVKARALLDAHPVRSLDEFRAVVAAHPDVLHEKQKIGLQYYEDFEARIPRKEMEKHEARIRECVKEMKCEVVGSYRRGAKDSGDIDVLLGFPDDMPEHDAVEAFHTMIRGLQESGYVTDVLALGPKKFMGVCRLPRHKRARRLDLLLTSAAEYPYALLYFTGSDKYNIAMRKHALARGYTLNEHGMKPVREGGDVQPVPSHFRTEEEVVAFLGLEWVPPIQRVG